MNEVINIPILDWGARNARERGPVIAGHAATRNTIGAHAGNFAIYRALAIGNGILNADHKLDLTGTEPKITIGPFEQWYDSEKIVTFDPWGHRVASDFSEEILGGLNLRPTIAITTGCLQMPEISQALQMGRIKPDDNIISEAGNIQVTKVAIEPVWWLPGIAHRMGIEEAVLRDCLVQYTEGMYPELITRQDIKIFLPPIGGISVYLFGDLSQLGHLSTNITCRMHDECNGSDVFGSDLCTCRLYLAFGVEECIRAAQKKGIGVIVYNRKEGRALGEVVKLLVYNARAQAERGDLADSYFYRTEQVAGVQDIRAQELSVDVLHWLGITQIDRWISMSIDKRDALIKAGIRIIEQIEIPEEVIPPNANIEIQAKKLAGYFSQK